MVPFSTNGSIIVPSPLKAANEKVPVYWGVTPEASNALIEKHPLMARVTLKRVIWFHGFESLVNWIPNADFMHVDCKIITSPFLCMYEESEGEELRRQAEYALENVSSKIKGKALGTVAVGADLHCQINNLNRGQQLMFDCLDEVLDYRIEK